MHPIRLWFYRHREVMDCILCLVYISFLILHCVMDQIHTFFYTVFVIIVLLKIIKEASDRRISSQRVVFIEDVETLVDSPYDNEICAICMEDNHQDIFILRCGHSFHKECIRRWIEEYQGTCPVCRENV